MSFVIVSGRLFSAPLVLRDEPAEKYGQIDLEEYFTQTYEEFSVHLKKLGDFSRSTGFMEEKEIFSLLETLIETKDMIRIRKEIE